jgi:hypothetical protein
MSGVRVTVIVGNPQAEKWETVATFGAHPIPPIDWSNVRLDDERIKAKWHSAFLPDGETIEVNVITYDAGCTINVRQGSEPIAQVLGAGRTPCFCFRTLGGQTVNIQVHDI